MMHILPTLDMAKRTSKQRITPMIEAMSILKERVKNARSRGSGNTQLVKEYPNEVVATDTAKELIYQHYGIWHPPPGIATGQ